MNNKLSISLALAAGLVGGSFNRYLTPMAAFAQNQAPVTKEIRAQSFTLVDASNRTVGTFTVDSAPPTPPPPPGVVPIPPPSGRGASGQRVVLRDANGREIWSAGGTPRVLPASQIPSQIQR